ncbi:MAG: hypothetical protein ACKPGT_14515 [Microcystis sp.]
MGESKRRKMLDPDYEKSRKLINIPKNITTNIPTEIPKDYLQTFGYRRCFGYYYCVSHRDCSPAFFITSGAINLVSVARENRDLSFSIVFPDSIMTIETFDYRLVKTIKQKLASNNHALENFVVTPNIKKIYKDKRGNSVLPFEINGFCSLEDYETKMKQLNYQPRIYCINCVASALQPMQSLKI